MKTNKTNIICAVVVVFIAIISKIIQFTLLPRKYFYDSIHILRVMNGSKLTDKSYSFTADFFKSINIFGFDNIYAWSIFLTIIFTVIIAILFLLSKKKYTKTQYLFLFLSIALLNIYVFNLSKEIIQLLIFFVSYLVLRSRSIKKDWQKILLCSMIFLLESFYFRIYYLILAALIPVIYIAIKKTGKKNANPYKILTIVIAAFFALTLIAGLISSDGLGSILTARSSVNERRIAMGDKNAITMIHEVFGSNTNYLIFCLNYIVDFVRLVIPIELIMKGAKYLPFVLYQIGFIVILFKTTRNKRVYENNILIALSIIIGFVMVSAIFEPDFGSFVRHEATLFPLQMFLIENRRQAGAET